jgi:hypothetical protein
MEQLGSHWTDFYEILRFSVFRKSDVKIQVWLKSAQIICPSHEGSFTFVIICCWFLLRMKNVSDKTCREKSKHILFSNNMGKYNSTRQFTDDNIIRRMRFAGWITKATDTHSEYVIYCFSMTTVFTQTLPYCYVVRTLPVLFCLISQVYYQWLIRRWKSSKLLRRVTGNSYRTFEEV